LEFVYFCAGGGASIESANMAKSRRKSSALIHYKRRVGRPETQDELLQKVEYYHPRVYGFLPPKKFQGLPLLPFERAAIHEAVSAVPRKLREPNSRWATRIVAHLVSQPVPVSGSGRTTISYRYFGSISGGRVRNMLTEIKKARKAGSLATNSYEEVIESIRNADVELPIDVTG
jgi:hypothetical protein